MAATTAFPPGGMYRKLLVIAAPGLAKTPLLAAITAVGCRADPAWLGNRAVSYAFNINLDKSAVNWNGFRYRVDRLAD